MIKPSTCLSGIVRGAILVTKAQAVVVQAFEDAGDRDDLALFGLREQQVFRPARLEPFDE